MFCSECGTKFEEETQFCPDCGNKITPKTHPHSLNKDVFYNQEWRQANIFVLASIPHLDILIDENSLYLIKLPASSAPTWGLLIGLLGSLIGAVIGAAIGNSIASKKRQRARDVWVNSDNKLISSEYENYVFLKIPLEDLKNHLSYKKDKYLVFTYSSGKLTIKKNKDEFVKVTNYLKQHAL